MEPDPPRGNDRSSRFAIATQRPVAILMVVMAVCVFGGVSYQRLSLDLMPAITYPTLTVRTEFPGTAPEDIETLISRPLEQELGILRRLVSISSISKAGLSDIVLEFDWDADINTASQDIRQRVDRTGLPADAGKPLLLRYDPSMDPIVRLALFGTQDLYELRYLAEHDVKRELEGVPGVAAVKVRGGLEEEIRVAMNEQQMAMMGLDIVQINRRLADSNVNLPGGRLREGRVAYLVRTLSEFGSLDQITNLVVAQRDDVDIRLGDIAEIYRAHQDRQVITRVNGRESVELEIFKEADANMVEVARLLRNRLFGLPEQRAYVADLEPSTDTEKAEDAVPTAEHLRMTDFVIHQLPPGAEIEVLSDRSVFIANSIEEVQKSALLGGAMAILVLFFFLRNIAHTFFIGLAIPVSIIATFAPMYLFDVSLNIMSLGGLALGVGMLVDNSIVVLESIFRCREEGDDLIPATVRGTGEVGGAVFASTLTTIAVFFPIVFVEGIAGQVFGDMAMTVVFSLMASLAAALYFVPMLASRQVRRGAGGGLLAQLQHSDLLRLRAPDWARASMTASDHQLAARVGKAGMAVPYLLYELFGRILLIVATLLAAALKLVALVLFELLWWLAKPIELWIRPEQTFQASVSAWAEASGIGPWTFFNRVWPDILSFDSAADLASAMQRYCRWIPGATLVWTACRALSFPLVLIYLVFRFVFHSALRFAGMVLLAAVVLVGLTIAAVASLLRMLLMPLLLPALFFFRKGFGLLQSVYPALLGWALHRRLLVIALAAASLLMCWWQLVPELGRELIPRVRQGEFDLDISLPVGTPLHRNSRVLQGIENTVLQQPQVEGAYTIVGTERTEMSHGEEPGEHTGRITIRMPEGSNASQEKILIERLRSALANVPEVEIEVSHPSLFSFKTPIELKIHGHDLPTLRRMSRAAEDVLSTLPGLADVRSSLQTGSPELQINYDRERLAGYGLDMRDVAERVRTKVQGRVATHFRQGERQIQILVQLREDDRMGIEELRHLVINPEGEIPIPLTAVADILLSEGPSEIRRIDQQRTAVVSANIDDIDLGTASRNIDAAMRRYIDYPPGFGHVIGGQNHEMETSLRSLLFALALAVFLVYIVMASQFESLVHPFVIMFTVPLAFIGVAVALHIADIALSIVVLIGLIMLAGIVVNNAIVLVDYVNTLRRSGVEKTEAIVQASTVRLRPIVMTTLTTVLALLPMALGLGEGSEIRMPMALTVIAGLTSSTFLTLVVIPTVYSLVDRSPEA